MSQAQAFLQEVADASVWALRWHRAQVLGKTQVIKVSAPGGHLGAVSVHFGTILGCGGYLERPWGPCVPHLCVHTLKHVIFASFWEPLGVPSGPAREALAYSILGYFLA